MNAQLPKRVAPASMEFKKNNKVQRATSRRPAAAAGLSWFETTIIADVGNDGLLTMRV